MENRVKKKKIKSGIKVFFLSIMFIIITGFFSYQIFKTGSQIVKSKKEKKQIELALNSLKEKEEKLTDDVEKLNNHEYVARYLREKYYYSTKGEYIIRLPNEG